MTCDSELDCIEDNSGNNKGGERQTRGQRPFFTLTDLNNILLFQIEMNTWIASSSLKALVNFLDKATTLHKSKNDSESVKHNFRLYRKVCFLVHNAMTKTQLCKKVCFRMLLLLLAPLALVSAAPGSNKCTWGPSYWCANIPQV